MRIELSTTGNHSVWYRIFNGISTFSGDLRLKPTYLTYSYCGGGDTKGISLKGNAITQLEFELAYFDASVQHSRYNASGTLSESLFKTIF